MTGSTNALHAGYHAADGRQGLARWSGPRRPRRHLYVAIFAGIYRSVRGVIGLRQVDGMPHGLGVMGSGGVSRGRSGR